MGPRLSVVHHTTSTCLIGPSTGNGVRLGRHEVTNVLIQVKTNFLKVSSLYGDKTAHFWAIIDGYTLQYLKSWSNLPSLLVA